MAGSEAQFAGALTIPFGWDRVGEAPTAQERDAALWGNQAVCKFLLHEIDLEAATRVVDERLGEALAPLRTKLDMIIELVGRLSYRDVELPPARPIRLTHNRVAWSPPRPVTAGDWVLFKLYFHSTFLEPIALYARVASCIASEPAGFDAQAELDEIPDAMAESFARLAFLAQRRQLGRRPAAATPRSRA